MADPQEVKVTCQDVNATLRRVSANSLEIAAQEMERSMVRRPDAKLDPGRKWAIIQVQAMCDSLRAEEHKNHDTNRSNR